MRCLLLLTALGLVLGEEVPYLLRYHGERKEEDSAVTYLGTYVRYLRMYGLTEWNGDDFAAPFIFTPSFASSPFRPGWLS